MKLKWTGHGAVQLAERTSWSPDDVQTLADEDKIVVIGIDNKRTIRGNRRSKSRVHGLAYDEKMTDWFVVVWDEESLEVVTVLPIAFHNRCAWIVTDAAMRIAKSKVIKPPVDEPTVKPVEPPKPVGPPPAKYRVTAMVRVTSSFTQAMFIGRFDEVPPVSVVREKLKERSLDHLEIGCVYLKKGKKSDPIMYSVVGDEYRRIEPTRPKT